MSAECGVFRREFREGLAQLALGSLCLRLDRELDNRFREFHGLKDYRMLLITDRISCCGELESDRCSDISLSLIHILHAPENYKYLIRLSGGLISKSDACLLYTSIYQNVKLSVVCGKIIASPEHTQQIIPAVRIYF